jgi:hypothetical protein
MIWRFPYSRTHILVYRKATDSFQLLFHPTSADETHHTALPLRRWNTVLEVIHHLEIMDGKQWDYILISMGI